MARRICLLTVQHYISRTISARFEIPAAELHNGLGTLREICEEVIHHLRIALDAAIVPLWMNMQGIAWQEFIHLINELKLTNVVQVRHHPKARIGLSVAPLPRSNDELKTLDMPNHTR